MPLCLAGISAPTLNADVPTYSNFELQARSNIVDGYNLPAGSSFNSGTIAVNDNGDVAFRLVSVGITGKPGVWFGGHGAGSVVYTAPSSQPTIGDPSLNSQGFVTFQQYDFSLSDGVFVYDPLNDTTSVAVPPGGMFGFAFMSSPTINDSQVIAFRGKDGANRQGFYTDDAGLQTRYVGETSVDPSSPYAFLFTPAFNNNNEIAGKGRVGSTAGSAPDEIRLWSADGSSILIAVDDDGDPASPFTGFDNSVALNDAGQVAFIASLVGGGRGVYLGDGSTTIEIATTADPDVSAVEFFAPEINNNGLVAFRGKDGQGLYAIFVGDGSTLRRVIGEHDLLPTDLGTGRIDQHDGSVVFGGGLSINNHGDIGFNCALTPENNNQIEWGSGMYVAYADPSLPGDLDGDCDVDQADLGLLLASYLNDAGGDLDGDGDTDQADLGILLANYGQSC